MAVRIESQAEPIPGYRLIERIGGGGFGEVWKAEAPGGLMKAIKFVFGNLETVDADGARAEQELKALNRVKTVRHPYILSLEQIIILDGQLIIIMELADRNLWDRFREARAQGLPGIPRSELMGYMEEIAEALDLMNAEHDLQHLDIKPQNLFLIHNHVKVADFGLVKDLEGLQASVTGGVTPYYAAPETFEGYVSRFSDQYSFAIVYQELLTGKRPFNANNTRQLIVQHLHGQPDLEPLSAKDRPIVARSLAKKPNDRYPTCRDFVNDLRKAEKRTQEIDPEELRRYLAEVDQQTIPVKKDDVPAKKPSQQHTPVHAFEPVSASSPTPSAPVPRRAEKKGEGVLFPSLVIGLGQLGAEVLAELRMGLLATYDNLSRLPHFRMLYIDTDTEMLDLAVQRQLLAHDETLALRLNNRHSHYLRPRDPLPNIETWLDPKIIYRIPREAVTTGVRALGRLALIDNYGNLETRLRYDLEKITRSGALQEADKAVGLGMHSDWPRVYVVANLAGGTGSGIFLDIAYVIRSLLRNLGFPQSELVGLFLLPTVDEQPARALAIANIHAALLELHHYTVTDEGFHARYDSLGPPFKESGAPFQRSVFLPMPMEADSQGMTEFIQQTATFLQLELFSPLGRDAERQRAQSSAAKSDCLLQSFGLQMIRSPRRTMMQQTALRLGKTAVNGWLAKAPIELAPELRRQMAEFMQSQKLDSTGILEQMQAACNKELEQAPDQMFAGWLEPIKKTAPPAFPPLDVVRTYFLQVDQLLGSPKEMASSWRPPRVPTAINDISEKLLNQAWQAITQSINQFLDKPGYRQGGAEEAVRQTTICVEEWLKPLEQQAEQLEGKLKESTDRLTLTLSECEKPEKASKLSRQQRATLAVALPDLLLRHPMLRYQQILVQALIKVYFSLRGRLSDKMRELGYCRQRLRELMQAFHSADEAATAASKSEGEKKILLPGGCKNLQEAVAKTVESMTQDDMQAIDSALQTALHTSFPNLVLLGTSPGAEVIQRLQRVIQRAIEGYLESRMPHEDVAELFLGQSGIDPAMEIDQILDEARPILANAAPAAASETVLLAVPDSPTGQQFLKIAQEGMPTVQGVVSKNQDEIVFYRESIGLKLAEFDQMGPEAQTAYRQACAHEHFTPHARQDIMEWSGPE